MRNIVAFICTLLLAGSAYAVDVTNSFTAGTTAVASEVDANFTTFEAAVDGLEIIKQDLSAQRWNIPTTAPAAYDEVADTLFDVITVDFATGADDNASTVIHIPSSYINTVDPTLRIDWIAPVQTSGTVCFCIATASIADSAASDAAATDTNCDEITTDGVAADLNQTTITITGADFVAGAMQLLLLSRDVDGGGTGCADDTLSEDAQVISAVLTYTVND